MCKTANKMTQDDLIGLLHFRSRGGAPRMKKGKGSYTRKQKHRDKDYEKLS